MSALRILFVSGFFPPYSPMGAVRPPMLAAYWQARGCDLRVVAIHNPALEGLMESPVRREQVRYVPFDPTGGAVARTVRSVKNVFGGASGTVGVAEAEGDAAVYTGRQSLQWLRRLYRQSVEFPDRYRSWIRPAVEAGRDLARDWRPDLVYSSAPPHSGHIVAQRLGAALGVPWVAELRDPWATNLHDNVHPVVKPFRRHVAVSTLRHAAACITLSENLAREVEGFTRRKVTVSYNGYNRDDFDDTDDPAPFDPERLTIIHAGAIYAERRDPSPLFRALATLGDERRQMRVQFYHDEQGWVLSKAHEFGVADCVEMCPPVPRKRILQLERVVDVLLLCRWDHSGGDGIIPGKMFEYIGARRPILSVGSRTGEAAEILRRHDFGCVENDPAKIAQALRQWLAEKRAAGGRVPDLPAGPTADFLRDGQFDKVDEVVRQVLARHRSCAAAG